MRPIVVRQNAYLLTPNDLINAGNDGWYEFRTWSAKIYGTYQGPWDLRVTPYLRHQSGQPFGRTFSTTLNYGRNIRILAEPMDTRRMDNITILDLRVEKGFRRPPGSRKPFSTRRSRIVMLSMRRVSIGSARIRMFLP